MCAWINVAQHDLLFPALSARQHLRMYARIKGVGSKEEVTTEVERLLKEVGLDHVGDAPVSTFSGGMKRRCSIAVACIGDVKVLLLDEPTTGALSCPRFEAGFLLLLSTLVSRPCSTNSTLLLCIGAWAREGFQVWTQSTGEKVCNFMLSRYIASTLFH